MKSVGDKAYFISDLHLGSEEEPKSILFLKFLKQIKDSNVTHLFLVGDIFDLWLADHQFFKDKFKKIIKAISDLVESGVQIHYFEGNHDLYLTDFWQNKLGVKVHGDYAVFDVAGLKVRVEHGDLTDPDDKGYLFLRKFLRTFFMQYLGRHMPGSLAAGIGKRASEHSRRYTSEVKIIDPEVSLQKLRDYAHRVCRETPFDFLITGHIHLEDDYSFSIERKNCRSVNLGTWLKRPVVFIIDSQEQVLKTLSSEGLPED